MRRWLAVGVALAVGCGSATNETPSPGDAGGGDVISRDATAADSGLTLEARQFQAAAALESEMSAGLREMQVHPGASRAAFTSALAAWNAAVEHERAAYRSDAAATDQRAAAVQIRVSERFPAYCDMRAAIPELTPATVPRIPCPAPAPAQWWERYATR